MTTQQIIALIEVVAQLAGVAAGLVENAQSVIGSDDRAQIETQLAAIAASNEALTARLGAKLVQAEG